MARDAEPLSRFPCFIHPRGRATFLIGFRAGDQGGQLSERRASGAVKPSGSEAERRVYHQRSPPQRAVALRLT